jgi:hypothetical protein
MSKAKTILETMCYNIGGFEQDISKGFYSLVDFPISELEANLQEICDYIGSEYYPSYVTENTESGTLAALAYNFKNKTQILVQNICQ